MTDAKRQRDQRLAIITNILREHPDWGSPRISKASGIPVTSVKRAIKALKQLVQNNPGDAAAPESAKIIEEKGAHLAVDPHAELKGRHVLRKVLSVGKWRTLGLVADTHLACREERLAELHATYDLFAAEGIKQVFHAGNLVDGYIPRINQASVLTPSIDGQTQYAVDNYPQRDGITTYYITGDDHEGWWIKTGFNWGKYLEQVARAAGRKDLKYIGHVEADVELPARHGSAIMKVQHPGGGSAYARSYTAQKQIESFEGGEKPQILVQGHYHVSNFMQDRNCYVVGMPGFQDQTVFARKKRLRMEIGGAIIRFLQHPDGSIHRFQIEWIRYFTRGYYKAYLPSDETIKTQRIAV